MALMRHERPTESMTGDEEGKKKKKRKKKEKRKQNI
jgi:hypothetical protein